LNFSLRRYAGFFLKSELIKNTSVLVSGTVAAHLITLLLQPLIRRFYLPGDFGSFSYYLSVIGILSVIATFRYDDAIVLPEKREDAANLVFLTISSSFVFNLLLFFALWFFGEKLLAIVNLDEKINLKYLPLIPLSIFFLNVCQSFNYWLIREKRFIKVSANKMIRRGMEGSVQTVSAFTSNPGGLMIGDITGQFANAVSATYFSLKTGFRLVFINPGRIKEMIKRYSDFPVYNLLPALMSTCSFFLPPIIITTFYSTTDAGYYDLSRTLLSIPAAFVASSISNVILQKIAEKYQKGESFLKDLKPVLILVISVAIAEVGIILLYGNSIFTIIFGKNWGPSGEISRILVWSFAISFFVSSFSCIFISMRKIKLYSVWQIFYFFCILSLFWLTKLSFYDFLRTFVVIEIGCFVIVTIMALIMIRKYEVEIKRN
jgi:O-antigen/teichoic acid export membrane protein